MFDSAQKVLRCERKEGKVFFRLWLKKLRALVSSIVKQITHRGQVKQHYKAVINIYNYLFIVNYNSSSNNTSLSTKIFQKCFTDTSKRSFRSFL
jgi:hypothetical protein